MCPRLSAIAVFLLCVSASQAQQTLDPERYATLRALFAACNDACTILVAAPQTFPDHGNLRVPANARITFTAAGLWTLPAAPRHKPFGLTP